MNAGDLSARADPPDDDRDLLRRYHGHGDEGAREALVKRHLPLVRSLARRYANRGESLDDIEQVASIGLLKAIDRFQLERGVSLPTYATPTIVGEIKRHFRDSSWGLRVPRSLQELNAKISTTIAAMTSKLGRSPRISEIADALDTTPENVIEAIEVRSAYTTLSLSPPAQEDGPDPLDAIGEEDDGYARTDDRSALAPALGRLPAREREILLMRFEQGLLQTQIAERVGLSQMHVSRLIRTSLAALRDELERA
ncbi:MAG: SigB/SigF/SigG family RNA polymerase sigma factor [Thermoleophilaceae bacterium]